MKINGIHHVSALTANAQKNVDFYRQILGLKLVKKQSIKMIHRCIIYFMEMKSPHLVQS